MAYFEITGLPLQRGEGEETPSVSLTLEKGRGLSILSTDGRLPQLLIDILKGKTTFSGEIILNDKHIEKLPGSSRNIKVIGDEPGFVPHLTVRENLDLALENQPLTAVEADLVIEKELSQCMLAGLGDVRADSIDAGARTILAIERALLTGCELLLITHLPVPFEKRKEPPTWRPGYLLDTLLDIKTILRRHKATWISTLTDPACVHILSDRVAIYTQNRLLQEGSLRECLTAPASRVVADFLAFPKMNYKKARIERDGPFIILRTGRYGFKVGEYIKRLIAPREGQEVILGVKPEDLFLRPYETGDPTAMNLARVAQIDSIPGALIVKVDADGAEWISLTEPGKLVFTGQLVELRPDPDKIHLFHPLHGASILD